MEESLLRIADRVLDFDEASLAQLQEKYLKKGIGVLAHEGMGTSYNRLLPDQLRPGKEQDFQ